MEINYKLESFEGPLDLLLHLIDKNKINIYDIPIVLITEQYLAYVEEHEWKDLDSMSEFLVMASTLIAIKSKLLLPPEIGEDGEEIDPRSELVEQLLQYKMYKYMSYELKDRHVEAERVWYRSSDIPKEIQEYVPPVDLDELCAGLDLSNLQDIFDKLMKRTVDRVDVVHAGFGKIEKEVISLPDKITYVGEYAKKHRVFSFRSLLEKQASRMEMVVTFMAILEMIKTGELSVSQEKLFDDIHIVSNILPEETA